MSKFVLRVFEDRVKGGKSKEFPEIANALPLFEAKNLTKCAIHCHVAVRHFRTRKLLDQKTEFPNFMTIVNCLLEQQTARLTPPLPLNISLFFYC